MAPWLPALPRRPLISSATFPWASEKTWKPPESVMIAPLPVHELVQAAERADALVARAEDEVERVAQDHLVAERRHLVGIETARPPPSSRAG